jgi:hypothetical protein
VIQSPIWVGLTLPASTAATHNPAAQ